MKNIPAMPQPPPARFNPQSLPKYILFAGIVWIVIAFLVFIVNPFFTPAGVAGIVVFLSLSFIGTVVWFAHQAGVAYRAENQQSHEELGAARERAEQARARTEAIISVIGDAISVRECGRRDLYPGGRGRAGRPDRGRQSGCGGNARIFAAGDHRDAYRRSRYA